MACGGWELSGDCSGSGIVSVGGAASVNNFGGGLGPLGGGLGPLGGGLGPIGGGSGTGVLSGQNLELRLRAGIEADRRYQAENNAKLRAIHAAGSYEDFRQMVLGCQLRPLERGDRQGNNNNSAAAAATSSNNSSKPRPSLWNSLANSASKRCGGGASSGTTSGMSNGKTVHLHHHHHENSPYPTDVHYDLNNPPSTTEGLVQLWGRLDLAERLDLVRRLNTIGVDKLAGGLVAGGLLGDAITTLLAFTPTPGDVVMVVAFLHALTQAKRFNLSVQLVCGEERWAWGRLLEKLQLALSERPQDLAELNVTEWTIVQLKAKFNL